MKRSVVLMTLAMFAVACTGPRGPTGPQGPTGMTGAQGPTGSTGRIGSQGMTGAQGETGAQGQPGLTESSGAPSAAAAWISLREISFDYDKAEIRSSEMTKISEIASYMRDNPGIRLGIDGSTDLQRGANKYNVALSQLREANVRDALIRAGVAANRMEIGSFAAIKAKCSDRTENCAQRDGRVEVLAAS